MVEHWIRKFQNAFRGIYRGSISESSFYFHVFAAHVVVLLAFLLRCEIWQWCVLLMCIALVMSLELCNSAIEQLAHGLCEEQNESVGNALDIASGAVLLASILVSVVGLLIFLQQGQQLFFQ